MLVASVTLGTAGAQDIQTPPTESPASARPRLKLTVAPEYTEGTYGTHTTTAILETPVKLDWSVTTRLDFELTVPYLWEHGRNIIAAVGTGRARVSVPSGESSRVQTEAGLGDVLLEATYKLLEQRGPAPELVPYVQIKFPTADSRRGLGTGEFDEGLGVRLEKSLGEEWTAEVDVSYTFVGSPPGTRLHDSIGWSVGLSYDVTERLRLSSILEGATAVSPHQRDPLAVRVRAEYDITKTVQLTAGGLAGLTSGSPAFGVSTEIAWRF